MPAAARHAALVAGALALGTVACGHTASETPRVRAAPPVAPPSERTPPSRGPAPRSAARVIRRWSDTLRGGDVRRAATYFALPSIVQIQPGERAIRITRFEQALAFNFVLPCGARLLRAERHGRYVNALFLLTDRPGATCDAPGATARTEFVIRRGRITEWRRAPDEPGDADEPVAGPPV